MLEPPPSTLPMGKGGVRPLSVGVGWPVKFQSRALPMFSGQRVPSMTSGTLSLPPASISSTRTSGLSARRRATAQPAEPEPQTMKSYSEVSAARLAVCWACALSAKPAMPAAAAAEYPAALAAFMNWRRSPLPCSKADSSRSTSSCIACREGCIGSEEEKEEDF